MLIFRIHADSVADLHACVLDLLVYSPTQARPSLMGNEVPSAAVTGNYLLTARDLARRAGMQSRPVGTWQEHEAKSAHVVHVYDGRERCAVRELDKWHA